MVSLADKVIQVNEEDREREEKEAQELAVDDIGLPLPKPQTERAWCEYLTARFIYLNPDVYVHLGRLWIDNEILEENPGTYYTLAKYPKKISEPECRYIFRRLKEVSPILNTDIIEVLPGVTFNMRTGKFKHEDVQVTRPWDKMG